MYSRALRLSCLISSSIAGQSPLRMVRMARLGSLVSSNDMLILSFCARLMSEKSPPSRSEDGAELGAEAGFSSKLVLGYTPAFFDTIFSPLGDVTDISGS